MISFYYVNFSSYRFKNVLLTHFGVCVEESLLVSAWSFLQFILIGAMCIVSERRPSPFLVSLPRPLPHSVDAMFWKVVSADTLPGWSS